jgi:hypothetical protein
MDIETGERKIIARGTQGRYVASGHLVYTVDGVLQAVPFDLDTRMMRGTPVPVLQQFRMVGGLIPVLDVAATGTLVYGLGSAMSRVPVWVDREGHETAIKGPTSMYQTPRLSPDGRRLAYFDITSTGEYDVWILDLERGTADRLTTDPGRDSEPIWSPDSTRIAYLSGGQAGGPGVFVRRADGAGTVERLTNGVHLPMHWSADGKWLAYADFRDQGISIATVSGIMKVQIDGDHTPPGAAQGKQRPYLTNRALGRRHELDNRDRRGLCAAVSGNLACAHAHFHRWRPESDVGARWQDALLSARASGDGRECRR